MRLIVPYGPEGASDRVGRALVAHLDELRGIRTTVEHRPGGGTVPGTLEALAAPPDGETLVLVTTTNLCIAPLAHSRLPYDPVRDIDLLAVAGEAPNVLAVPPSLGIASVADLVGRARARPGVFAYASAGAGQTIHLCGAVFAALAGLNLRHVPYAGGSSAAYDDLRAGRVQMMFDSLVGALQDLRDGSLRPLAVVAAERNELVPHVPTMREAGIEGFAAPIFLGLGMSTRVPIELRDALRAELAGLIETPGLRATLATMGVTPARAGPAVLLGESRAAWQRNLELAGLRVPQ